MTRGAWLATEWLWCNFPPPVALLDYRHLGASYRERRRIKRLKSTNLPPTYNKHYAGSIKDTKDRHYLMAR